MLRDRIMMGATISSLPEGYTNINYLESNGSQFIDTGFVPNQDTRVKMSILASGLSGETYAYGARNSAGSNAFLCALEPAAITFGYAIQYREYKGVIDGRYDIDQNKNIMTVNGTEISGNYVESFGSESNLTLFGRNTAGSVEKLSAIKLYSCQIYDNGTLVRDFIPAMNASGEAGLYDLKNGVWYALKPVVTKKVENKISTWRNVIFEDENYIYDYESGLQSEYPVASNITVTANVITINNIGIRPQINQREFTILKGTNNTGAVLSGGHFKDISSDFLDYSSIVSISPTEDDTYIYTF